MSPTSNGQIAVNQRVVPQPQVGRRRESSTLAIKIRANPLRRAEREIAYVS
ncbi:hypothetical protein [Actomonas aquatica]|uniref:Uncharacterized protein n=1 Tax=Actomonas aquatica TaxID=2866162 RepID=A0ABZ1C7T5_9BACT|nr:hypothetical protein [Opitutus sp. WL0086]WRQ87526.1 hypothetical protein K1X11_022145 [Opitutus sp. WL0086]